MEPKESVLLLPTRLTVMTSLALSTLKTRRVEAVVAHVTLCCHAKEPRVLVFDCSKINSFTRIAHLPVS